MSQNLAVMLKKAKSTCVGWSSTWATANADIEFPSALFCQVCRHVLQVSFSSCMCFNLPTVRVSKTHPEVPGQIYSLPKKGNLVPVLLQPKVEDGVKVVQPAAMKSPKV